MTQLIIWLRVLVTAFLGYPARYTPITPSTSPDIYRKIASQFWHELARLEASKQAFTIKLATRTKKVKPTSTTGRLFAVITNQINIYTNSVAISLSELQSLTNMSRETLITHIAFLEQIMKVISVDRSRATSTKNDINVYHLCGIGEIALAGQGGLVVEGWSSEKTRVVYSVDGITFFNKHTNNTGSSSLDKNSSVQNASIEELPHIPPEILKIVPEQPARELITEFGEQRVLKCSAAINTRNDIKNPGGFLFKALKGGWDVCPAAAKPEKVARKSDEKLSAEHGSPPPEYTQEREQYNRYVSSLQQLLQSQITAPAEAVEHWNIAYNQLELQLDRASFDTWLRAATLLRVENDTYIVGVRHQHAADMCQHRLYRNIRRVLSDATGRPDTQLQFKVIEKPIGWLEWLHQEDKTA